MDRFKEIDAFVQVMAHGSLAAAALAEGVTPVMMGRRLDALEQRLGTQLVIRSTRRLTLTDQGASYLDECRQLLARWDEAERAVSSQHQRASGHLIHRPLSPERQPPPRPLRACQLSMPAAASSTS